MIRTILVVLYLVVFFIISLPLFLIEFIIGKFNPDLKERSSLAYVNWGFRCVAFWAGCKTTYIGLENVPKDQAVFYIGNHRSFFDVVLTYPKVKGPTGYVAKIEILKVPLLRTWMKNLHCLFLDRSNLREGVKMINTAIEYIKEGRSIFLFPEGTRSKVEGVLNPFHEGSFKIATKTNCPIIPVTIVNTGDIFEDHLPRIKSKHIIIEYGTPIIPNDLSPEDKKQIANYTKNIIETTYKKNIELI